MECGHARSGTGDIANLACGVLLPLRGLVSPPRAPSSFPGPRRRSARRVSGDPSPPRRQAQKMPSSCSSPNQLSVGRPPGLGAQSVKNKIYSLSKLTFLHRDWGVGHHAFVFISTHTGRKVTQFGPVTLPYVLRGLCHRSPGSRTDCLPAVSPLPSKSEHLLKPMWHPYPFSPVS